MHHTSRGWQNILHLTGTLYSVMTIGGAVLIGSQNYAIGITMMIVGALATRLTSEIDYRKWTQLFKEQK